MLDRTAHNGPSAPAGAASHLPPQVPLPSTLQPKPEPVRPPTLRQCERALRLSDNLPVHEWVGRCHQVCLKLLEQNETTDSPIRGRLEGATLTRGRWAGERAVGAPYPTHASDGHSWLTLADGRIFDPTCWAFTDHTPKITIAPAGDRRWVIDPDA